MAPEPGGAPPLQAKPTASRGRDEDFDELSSHHQEDPTTISPRRLRPSHRLPVYSAQHVFLAVDFTPVMFRVVWVTTLIVRLWCILFLAWTAQLYWFIAHPYMGYYASLIGPTAVANFKPMGVAFGIVAACHLLQVYQMLSSSIYYRRLVLGPPPQSSGPQGDTQCFGDWDTRFRSRQIFIRTMKRDLFRFLFDRHGPFGVESSLFYVRVLTSELLEISSQVTQVYNASVLVAKVWMNNLYVTVTVLNAWSTPAIRHMLHSTPDSASSAAWERFMCLTIDFLLDATTGMVIPMLIFVPYYQKFDFTHFHFELSFLYDDVWFANMVMENQQILAQNKWDFVWKMVPHLSMYGSLNSIRALVRPPSMIPSSKIYCATGHEPIRMLSTPPITHNVRPSDPAQVGGEVVESEEAMASTVSIQKPKLVPTFPPIREGKLLTSPSRGAISHDLSFLNDTSGPPSYNPSQGCRFLQNAMSVVLFVAGFAILVLHLRVAWRAQNTTDVISCATKTRPWFSSKVSCAVVRYNCYMNNCTDVTNSDLEMIEPSSVAALVFSHCPDMHVPTIITEFHNLLGIDFYNCTLYEWTAQAAITASAHPRLTYIILVRVKMTRLPDGVLQPLPDTMTDFEISVSNLTELPMDLHERWHPMSIFYVEHAQLTEFPPTLMDLHVDDLSLIGNQIHTLPEFAADTVFFSFGLSHTPLVELPQSIGDTSNLAFVDLAYTQLASLPEWMDTVAKTATKINVHNTPFCASKSDEEIAESYGADAVLCCVGDYDDRHNGKYPLEILAPNRLLDDPTMVPKIVAPVGFSTEP